VRTANGGTTASVSDLDVLVERATALAARGERVILGIAGAPGSGKSRVTSELVARLGASVVAVPMDGFHLDDEVLRDRGLLDRKGAPETFDVDGFVSLLGRIRDAGDRVVYAPRFDRSLEASLAGSVPVAPAVPLVIVEGNYLLLDSPGWREVRGLLDEAWFIAPPEELRLSRLVDRHIEFGRSPSAALAWAQGTDQRNALLVEATRAFAHLEYREA
jgi:pantothenate kinase